MDWIIDLFGRKVGDSIRIFNKRIWVFVYGPLLLEGEYQPLDNWLYRQSNIEEIVAQLHKVNCDIDVAKSIIKRYHKISEIRKKDRAEAVRKAVEHKRSLIEYKQKLLGEGE